MTYLELINNVLRELRETQVASVNQSTYSSFIAGKVNEAKRDTESAWDWKTLRTRVAFNTAANVNNYDLGAGGVGSVATNERSRLCRTDVWGTTETYNFTLQGTEVYERTLSELEWWNEGAIPVAQPYSFATITNYNGVTVRFVPAPDAVYTMHFFFIIPQDDLSGATDIIRIPGEPVWRRALAYAANERGGALGEAPESLLLRADRCALDYLGRQADSADLTMQAL